MSDEIAELRHVIARTKDPSKRLELLTTLAERLHRTEPAEGLSIALQAVTLARRRGDAAAEALALTYAGYSEHYLARNLDARGHFEAAAAIAASIDDATTLARAQLGIGITLTSVNEPARAIPVFWEALDVATRVGSLHLGSSIHNSLGVAYRGISDFASALEHYQTALDMAMACENDRLELMALTNVGVVQMLLGDLDSALASMHRASTLASGLTDGVAELIILNNLASVHARASRYAESLEVATRAAAIAEELSMPGQLGYALSVVAVASEKLGDFDGALTILRRSWAISGETDDEARWSTLNRLARMTRMAGDPVTARAMCETALEGARRKGDRSLEGYILEELSTCLEELGDIAGALETQRRMTAARDEAQSLRNVAALAEHRMRSEVEAARHARETAQREKRELEQQMARREAELTALALELAGHHRFHAELRERLGGLTASSDPRARAEIRSVVNSLESHASAESAWSAFERQFEQVHSGFQGRLSALCPTLSPTELRICALLRMNFPSRQIGEILDLSVRTVENHRLRIRGKLGLPEGTHLATFIAAL